MPVIRMNYLDLSTKQRRAAAKSIRTQLQAALADPHITNDQVSQLQTRLSKISAWEKGTLEPKTPKEMPPVAPGTSKTAFEAIKQLVQKFKT